MCVHICETCLFLLCESWDMSLFVRESCVTMCNLSVLCVGIYGRMDGSWCIFVCFYIMCIYSLASLSPSWGALGSRSDQRGEVRSQPTHSRLAGWGRGAGRPGAPALADSLPPAHRPSQPRRRLLPRGHRALPQLQRAPVR